ncbi:MAG: AraC family transcriptional regulator [Bermanella sp.]
MQIQKSAFCQVLGDLRVSGSVVMNRQYQSPWGITVADAQQLNCLLNVPSNVTVVPFHLVHKGQFEFTPLHGEKKIIRAGEMIICTNGQGHTMQQGSPTKKATFNAILSGQENVALPVGEQGETHIICGAFLLHNTRLNPLISALPQTLHLQANKSQANEGQANKSQTNKSQTNKSQTNKSQTNESQTSTLPSLFNLLVNEVEHSRSGQSYMLERQLEMLYAESIRAHLQQNPQAFGGWLQAVNDPRLGEALNHIHNHMENELSVPILAKIVNMSASRFSACFKELIGQPPMIYITQVRMQKAERLLRETAMAINEITYQCGYGSLAAFNRAFNKFFSVAPSKWRKQHQ